MEKIQSITIVDEKSWGQKIDEKKMAEASVRKVSRNKEETNCVAGVGCRRY